MASGDAAFLIFEVLGGLALFIFGMNVMTGELRTAAGAHLRTFLAKVTSSRMAGYSLGTALGFLVHSSAATVMLVGFVNAGLLTLSQAVPPVLGANFGTTISMQVISFRLDDYCFLAMAAGLLWSMLAPTRESKAIGRAVLGFGLLFLGMRIMSAAIRPHRELLIPLMVHIDGSNPAGMLTGILLSTLITGIIQSSGATIGMCFALISSGVFTDIHQIYPIVLGAHIGTCMTALLGSLGTNIEARRTAAAHLFFNILNVILGVAAAPWLIRAAQWSSADLTRQTANLHSTVILSASILLLPVASLYAAVVRTVIFSRNPVPASSYLDPKLLRWPEQALAACIKELQRTLLLATASMRKDAELFFEADRKRLRRIQQNETAINEIKLAIKAYLRILAHSYLSRRQVLLMQHINRCITDIERVGDHVEEISRISTFRQRFGTEAMVDANSFEQLFETYVRALHLVEKAAEALDPELEEIQIYSSRIDLARKEYLQQSELTGEAFAECVAAHRISPLSAFFFSEYLRSLDRIAEHVHNIAQSTGDPDFHIERKKIERTASPLRDVPEVTTVDPDKFMEQI